MEVFKANMVPVNKFAEVYPKVKPMLLLKSKLAVIDSFKKIEQNRNVKQAVKGSAAFIENKGLYSQAIQQSIEKALLTNRSLSAYLNYQNNDRITYFNSLVRIQPDGKLLVTENISIYNGNGSYNPLYGYSPANSSATEVNNEIQRGIVRTFPTFYINRYKLFQNTTFVIKEVLRNGSKESYHTKKATNGVALYIGNASFSLPTGNYRYTITYETNHQLKLLKGFDELYWNVNGTGWNFRVDSARCTVVIPNGAAIQSAKCYTGYQGDTATECRYVQQLMGDSLIAVFTTNKPLLPKQGLTVAVSWNKGFVTGMSGWQRIKYYIWNNRAVFLLPLAALLSALFMFIAWWRFGRDPKKGTVYPQYEPPRAYSPAALGYIYFQKFSSQLTAATVVDSAVRNRIKVDVEREGLIFKHNEYKFSKSDKPGKPPFTNYESFDSDVEDLIGSEVKKGKYNSDLADLNKTVRQFCEDNYVTKTGKKKKKGLFAMNDGWMIFPGILCVLTAIWAVVELVIALVKQNFWQIAYFVGGIILCVQLFRLFARLLKAYNPEGRKLRDEIEGFRMFLSTADEKRFDMLAPPQKTLELYEKYLPFAIALDCAVEWGNQFEDIIKTAVLSGAAVSSFSSNYHNDNSFGSSFSSSFTGTISSASTPPSSSSGGGSSFGGGSSGGGGGGGGGGGW